MKVLNQLQYVFYSKKKSQLNVLNVQTSIKLQNGLELLTNIENLVWAL